MYIETLYHNMIILIIYQNIQQAAANRLTSLNILKRTVKDKNQS